jgi:hypothetical protein
MSYRYIPTILLFLLFCSVSAAAQYSDDVMSLKNASDLYDERGHLEHSSISVDGKLMVAGANGSVSYSYPISTQVRGGYPINVTLNYAGAVSFTTYRSYIAAHDQNMTPYKGWEKFSQNRPVWILGVNGFALNVLSQTSHFAADSASRIFNLSANQFDDGDFTWSIDGFDACNRMVDLDPDYVGQDGYVDVIRLLRSDGSLLQLVNKHARQQGDSNAGVRQNLYTGYYIDNSAANASGYGFVEFDSTYWPEYIYDLLAGRVDAFRAAQVPRKLRYYDGSGLEYVFREWVIPYGPKAYRNYDHVTGGVWGGPTIFYLEHIIHRFPTPHSAIGTMRRAGGRLSPVLLTIRSVSAIILS